ncbi:MAG TPA: LysR family transcriptional regulator [Candidatus Acidoferrales bacterium]|nr:LysR family transcriptional regulator [Candidatus Acidoferrales bacterium]
MNLHQLEIFYAVAQRLSISAAASELRRTQPAVSLQIKALEKSLGIRLLDRSGPKLRLTQAGEALYRCAVTVLHAKDEALRAIAELSAATKGKLILGANITGGMYLLPRMVRQFKESYPETEVIFEIEPTDRICERVLQSAIDMGFVGGPVEDRRLGVEAICRDPIVMIVSPAHRWANRHAVAVRELEGQACILPAQGSRTRQLVERKLREAGASPRLTMQLFGTEAVKKAVEANLGVGFVSGYAVERECALGELKVVQLKGVELIRNMELIYRRQKYFSPVAERFRQYVHSFARAHLQTRPLPALTRRERA